MVFQWRRYTPALDLAQAGPKGPTDADANGRQQTNVRSMSNVMHSHHATVEGPDGEPLFPTMPPLVDIDGALPDPIKAREILIQTYRIGDDKATPIVPANNCFAENTVPASGPGVEFADGGHEELAEHNKAVCRACHGRVGEGTVLSAMHQDRVLNCDEPTPFCPSGNTQLFPKGIR